MATSVTVVICTWNRARLLSQTLESFLGVRIPEGLSWELLVVNNNCTDNTDQVVGQYADRLPIVLCHEPQPGKSNACNCAIKQARGEFILWTDDDVLVEPDWVSATLNAFKEHQAHLVFGKVLPWWEAEPPAWFSSQFDGMFALLDYGNESFVITDRRHQPFGVNMAMHRDVFQEVGGFTNDVGMLENTGGGCEDLEVFYRVLARGMRVVYTPHAVIHHFIPRTRCTKAFYRSRAWLGSLNHLHMLRTEAIDQKWLLGLPRYYYRVSLGYMRSYLAALGRRDKSGAFFYELKIIRFVGLLREALRRSPRGAPERLGRSIENRHDANFAPVAQRPGNHTKIAAERIGAAQ
jgi:glycosyltransferase involved in cell wall biosynthesis